MLLFECNAPIAGRIERGRDIATRPKQRQNVGKRIYSNDTIFGRLSKKYALIMMYRVKRIPYLFLQTSYYDL